MRMRKEKNVSNYVPQPSRVSAWLCMWSDLCEYVFVPASNSVCVYVFVSHLCSLCYWAKVSGPAEAALAV